jgi:hypothetical protein
MQESKEHIEWLISKYVEKRKWSMCMRLQNKLNKLNGKHCRQKRTKIETTKIDKTKHYLFQVT